MIILYIILTLFAGSFLYGVYIGIREFESPFISQNTAYEDYSINYDTEKHEDEIALLEIAIERRKEAALILENELAQCTDNKRKVTIISRLNTLDKQTFKDMRRIEKLRDS